MCPASAAVALFNHSKPDVTPLRNLTPAQRYRIVGLAWRKSSPLKEELADFGRLVLEAVPQFAGEGRL